MQPVAEAGDREALQCIPVHDNCHLASSHHPRPRPFQHCTNPPAMSLYDSGIQMLPRPDRSVFSIGSDATRAILPDFRTVAELSSFTNRLFNWHVQVPHLYAQAVFASTFIFFLIVIIGFIMAKRIYEGKFWLARAILRPSGLILVPNPMLAFLICAGLCCLVFTPFFLVTARQYANHTAPPRNLFLWYSLPWLALGHGLVWVLWGTYFATPGALLSPMEESALSPLKRFLRRADVISSMVLIIPAVMAVTLVVPAVIGSTQWQNALALERDWQAQYSLMPTFTQDMVQQSQQVWFAALKAAKTSAGVFILWTIYAFLMSIALFQVSFNLIKAVRQDLARAKRLEHVETMREEKMRPVKEVPVSKMVVDALHANKMPERKSNVTTRPSMSSIRFVPAVNNDDGDDNNAAAEGEPEGGIKFAANKTASPAQKQRKGLEQALFQIYIQLLGIGPAAFLLGTIALTFALTIHSKLEQPSADGGTQLEHYIGGIWLTLMYVICVAGALNYLPVIYKTAEDRFTRQATGQINFKDITRGTAHIKSTFLEANAEDLPMSPTSASPRAFVQRQLDDAVEALEQSRGCSITEDYNKQSWDVEAEPVFYSTESLSPPFRGGR